MTAFSEEIQECGTDFGTRLHDGFNSIIIVQSAYVFRCKTAIFQKTRLSYALAIIAGLLVSKSFASDLFQPFVPVSRPRIDDRSRKSVCNPAFAQLLEDPKRPETAFRPVMNIGCGKALITLQTVRGQPIENGSDGVGIEVTLLQPGF